MFRTFIRNISIVQDKLTKGRQITKQLKKNYSTEKPANVKTNVQTNNRFFLNKGPVTPEDEKVKLFKYVAVALGLGYTGYFAYQNYGYLQLPSKVKVHPVCDENTEQVWQEITAALGDLSTWEPLSRAGVIRVGIQQLEIALKDLTSINALMEQQATMGRSSYPAYAGTPGIAYAAQGALAQNKKQGELSQLEMYHLKARVGSAMACMVLIENTILYLCQLEANANEFINNGGMEVIDKLYKLVPEFQEQEVCIRALHNTMSKNPALAPALAKYPHWPQFTDTERFVAVMLDVEQKYVPTSETSLDILKRGLIIGVAGSLYCGLAWKLVFPRVQGGMLLKKMMWALVGCGVAPMITRGEQTWIRSPTAIKTINERIAGKSDDQLYSPTSLMAFNGAATALDATVLGVGWYFSKFILFPAMVGGYIYMMVNYTYEIYRDAQKWEQSENSVGVNKITTN